MAAVNTHVMSLPPPCFTDEVVCFGSWAVPLLLHTRLIPSLWYKLVLVSSVQRLLFQNCKGFFQMMFGKTLIWSSCFWGSPMDYILWWSLCIHSGEMFSWSLTLTHIHLPPRERSWSGQLLRMGFFFTGERIVQSSTTDVFRGLPDLLVLLSSPVRSSFLRMFQTVDLAILNVLAISLMGLSWSFILTMTCFTDSALLFRPLELTEKDFKCK